MTMSWVWLAEVRAEKLIQLGMYLWRKSRGKIKSALYFYIYLQRPTST